MAGSGRLAAFCAIFSPFIAPIVHHQSTNLAGSDNSNAGDSPANDWTSSLHTHLCIVEWLAVLNVVNSGGGQTSHACVRRAPDLERPHPSSRPAAASAGVSGLDLCDFNGFRCLKWSYKHAKTVTAGLAAGVPVDEYLQEGGVSQVSALSPELDSKACLGLLPWELLQVGLIGVLHGGPAEQNSRVMRGSWRGGGARCAPVAAVNWLNLVEISMPVVIAFGWLAAAFCRTILVWKCSKAT